MEHFGFLGLIPPVLTITLAFITKDVVVSLFLGILSGALIVAGGNPFTAFLNLTDLLADVLTDSWNIRICLFCALLGGLVGLMSRTGATHAFGRWAQKKIKSPKTSMLMAWFCGILIFIDDYFNSLAVGTVMRPICDENRVPRAKLAWILDSTAAPVCILVPISSWVITVMSIVKSSEGFGVFGISEFSFFLRSVPYNIYALLTLVMILTIVFTGRDYGPMKRSVRLAEEKDRLWDEAYGDVPGELNDIGAVRAAKSRSLDMILPVVILIVTALIFFPLVTWMGMVDETTTLREAMAQCSLGQAFNNTDASVALWYAVMVTAVFTYIYYLARGLFRIKEASAALIDGVKSMMPAIVILIMAWSIGSIIKSSPEDGGLGLARYLSELVVNGGFPIQAVPFIVFILSALIAFATGTSWGTFAIMIPIVMPIAVGLGQARGLSGDALLNATMISIAAVLGGAVFGDHASPISDTTILSSTGAGCPHLEHVQTQLPYALTAAGCSLVGFIVGGITLSPVFAWIATLIVFALAIIFLPVVYDRFAGRKRAK